jgi:uncharacterized membrane protein YkoI
MTLRSISVLAIPILLLACAGAESPARGGDASDSGNDNPAAPSTPSAEAQQILLSQLARTSVSLNEAIDSALAANPGSRVLGADLDGDDAEVRYEIELALADGSVVEVHIDAATGGIIATLSEDDADEAGDDSEDEEEDEDEDEGEEDEDDDVVSDCAGSISAQEALQIAETTASGTGVELEVDAEDCEFEVIVHTADGWVEVDVAADGTVVEVGSDEDESDEDDESDESDDESDESDEDEDEDESDESDEDEDCESDEDDESDDD